LGLKKSPSGIVSGPNHANLFIEQHNLSTSSQRDRTGLKNPPWVVVSQDLTRVRYDLRNHFSRKRGEAARLIIAVQAVPKQ
jgi:hypothetical protein